MARSLLFSFSLLPFVKDPPKISLPEEGKVFFLQEGEKGPFSRNERISFVPVAWRLFPE